MCLWDRYGLAVYDLSAGSIYEDARGRLYINITVKVAKQQSTKGKVGLGIDLGLKYLVAFSGPALRNVEAQDIYRGTELKLAMAQLANKKRLVKTIHAQIANRRKDHHHKLMTLLLKQYGAISFAT